MFDPFDDRTREKIKRRKTSEVVEDNNAWQERVDSHFRRALNELEWPDFTDSDVMLMLMECNPETNVCKGVLKRNFLRSMGRLGYEKFTSESNKSGRWKIGSTWTVVYFKRGTARIERHELKQSLGR
jgi:hypothetical protein